MGDVSLILVVRRGEGPKKVGKEREEGWRTLNCRKGEGGHQAFSKP